MDSTWPFGRIYCRGTVGSGVWGDAMTEDILEKAKAADPETLAVLDWGALRDLISGLITEVERLRSENKIISDRAAHHDRQDAKANELLAARIAELLAQLEAMEERIRG